MASSPFQGAFLAALVVLALGVPHAMAARSLGVVEWPCCRQYDTPPTATVTEAAEERFKRFHTSETDAVPAGHEEPFKRFHTSETDAVPVGQEERFKRFHTSEINSSPAGQEDRFKRFHTSATEQLAIAASSEEAVVDNAEPEWPCCRQYDAPPTV